MTKNKNKLMVILLAAFVAGLSFTNCDDNMPQYDNVSVENITLDEDLKKGVSIEIGDSLVIANKLTVFPENATNKMQTFSSSNEDVAVVDGRGKINTNSVGTTVITVTVDGKTDEFTLTVRERDIIEITEIEIIDPDVSINAGSTLDLKELIIIYPAEASINDLEYSSDQESVVEVNQNGIIRGIAGGTAKITVTFKHDSSVSGEFNVRVFEDYSREGWTLAASQNPLFVEGNSNKLEHALDGDPATWFALVKPGKSHAGISIPTAANGGFVYFIVDMKEERDVNYFRIRHRAGTDTLLRYRIIEEVSGSNDGVNFTTIATDVAIPNWDVAATVETPNLIIPASKYRYLKFYCQKQECFATDRGSVQLAEVYIGK
ncbi:MAG: Ig-like domain-containing protein [Proteiniphilum sp.]|uniref:Ig-like domain-containing protein n=1 Tax=Proteiniphilum sp. TaxID=1926877 RepID=UPI002AB9184D|nr:Ig-like domain-containing protein [Proteiniphilum sp.]MDY9917546.1 Ig-like domain-containing protein [Proteiniphilum sp.]